jgi:hypothetical protein
MNKLIAVLFAVVSTSAFAVDAPDAALTPGDVRTTNKDDICSTPGHKVSTKDVRNVSASTKHQAFANYGLNGNNEGYCSVVRGCEIDHLVSLELGGSNDVKNLWPQPYTGEWNAFMKDALENRLHMMVCTGQIELPAAQKEIATDWKAAWVKHVNRGREKTPGINKGMK